MSKNISTGRGRLQAHQRKFINIKQKGLSAMDNIKALDHMFTSCLGWGLEMYNPHTRLLPGEPLTLAPEVASQRPMLILVPDELKTGIQSSHYLWTIGLRGFTGRDPNHRDWNDVRRAVERAGLWGTPYI
jgi:hypothetical protein